MSGRTYGWFEVTSLTGPRFELALEFFQQGRPFIFDGVAFARQKLEVQCSVPSSWATPTDDAAASDLHRAEQVFERLVRASPEFAALSRGLTPALLLVSDYGTGTVVLAESRGGVLTWRGKSAG